MFAMIQESEERLKEERREEERREVERREVERREVGCQWERPEEERREEERREEERREVGCQWERPEEERREERREVERREEERREVGCQWERPEEERREEERREEDRREEDRREERREVERREEDRREERREVERREEDRREEDRREERREVERREEERREEERREEDRREEDRREERREVERREEDRREEDRREERREVGCQWERPEEDRREERREVGCQWERPEEERREEERREVERREVERREVERREVGCQWERLEVERREEERREVGCQSDSAERRDAAVQVDLLSQQLSWRHTGVCGVAWRCVSVRADGPGGGALLQHCRTNHSAAPGHSQLPTMPLFQSPAPPETTSLPSMPLCEPLLLLPPADVSAPPSGLIAPLSPHLAEEGEGGVLDTEQVRRPRRKRVGPPIRYLLESEGQSHGLPVANHSRGLTVEEEEEEMNVDGVEPVKTADTEQAGRPRRKTVGPPIRYLLESEEQSHGLSASNHSMARGAKVKMKPGRLRTEHQEEEEEERRGGVELCQVCGLTFTCESSLQLHLSVHRAGSSFNSTSPLHRHHHSKQEVKTNSDGERTERRDEEVKTHSDGERTERRDEEVKTLLPVSTKASNWLRCRKRVSRNPRWWIDFCITMRRRRQERDGARGRKRRRCREEEEQERGGGEEKGEELRQRPRRTRVGPPIRYLLESEELSHGPANQGRAGGWKEGRKPQKKISAEGGASGEAAMIDTPEFTGQSDQTNQDRVNRLKESGGRPNKVGIECEQGGGASERHKTLLPASTKATDWLRRKELGRRNPQWWADYRATMRRRQDGDGARGRKRRRSREEEEQERGGGEEKVEEEQPQRPWRTRVGPPIRYLLESEELSHGPANQGRAGDFQESRKPQKKSEAGGGTSDDRAMIDRPEDTDRQAERQILTNQDGLDGPNERGGIPNKVMETGGGASEMTGRATPVSDRQTGSYRRSYLVYINLQSSQVTVLSPCCIRLQRLPLIG